jgi:FKBP-type peptidyl-prolyl cis-trans isomerase
MIQKILISAGVIGCIFLCKDPAFARLNQKSLNSTNITQYLTQEEQKKLPLLIALSLKELCPENAHFPSFIEGLKIADLENTSDYQESSEIQAYVQYAMQVALDPKITKNLAASTKHLQNKQSTEDAITLINDKICYKILKIGTEPGITDNTINNIKINFTIKDIENNFLAGNYVLSGPLSCTLSELIPGMAHGMLEMRLNEVREIYVHPEFAYGIFSNFGNGRALAIQVELVECTATDTAFHPYLISVDLTKLLLNSPQNTDIASLQQDLITFYGKTSWSFYKQNLPQLHLNDVLPFLQSDAALSPEDKEILHKLQWLIYNKT